MKVITISGRAGSGKSTLAEKRYQQYVAQGLSVAMHDHDSFGDLYSTDSARWCPEVKIITETTPGDLVVKEVEA